jgi:RNA polymerase sigma factor for flagellar operon FliA
MTLLTDRFGPRRRVTEAPRELWEEFKTSGHESLRNRLIEHYLPLVRYTADRMVTKLPASVDVGDLYSAGVFGLMDAINNFDIDRGIKFKTYCSTRIHGAIVDALRQDDWVPRLVRNKANKVDRAVRELETLLGRQPDDVELAAHLEMSLEELDQLLRSGTPATLMSLSERWGDDESGKSMQAVDAIADEREECPVDRIAANDFMELVTRHLSMKERMIVMLYYFDELTMREIGMILDLSESRVCQIHARIVKKLRAELGEHVTELFA